MDHQEKETKILFDTIKKELVSIIEEGSERCEFILNEEKNAEKPSQFNVDCEEIYSPASCERNEDLPSNSAVFNTANILNINGDIQKLQNDLDESCKMFQSIEERFENINFGCLKNRVKDLHLNERNSEPITTIVQDLQQLFDENFIEKRLSQLTKEVASKFRNHPGEFGDIPEISEFFRTCTKLEQGLDKLRKQRTDCIDLQKRLIRLIEASYDRVDDIQQNIMKAENNSKII